MDNDNKSSDFAKSLSESLSKALNMPVFFQDNREQIKTIVDNIRNKQPAKIKQQFKDISDSEW